MEEKGSGVGSTEADVRSPLRTSVISDIPGPDVIPPNHCIGTRDFRKIPKIVAAMVLSNEKIHWEGETLPQNIMLSRGPGGGLIDRTGPEEF